MCNFVVGESKFCVNDVGVFCGGDDFGVWGVLGGVVDVEVEVDFDVLW